MRALRWAAPPLLLIALVTGTLSDVPRQHPPLILGGYHVLAADFHVHSSIFSTATLAPWDLPGEARRQGLDAFAITDHNQLFAARIGRWFSRLEGGPRVLVGEEIRSAPYHLIAVGIEKRVSWDQPAAGAIDDIHRQGGVAIAAHPIEEFWPAYNGDAMLRLDGSEVFHPIAFIWEGAQEQLRQFHQRRPFTAIGSSDYHGVGAIGLCRTFVFAREDSEQGIVEALRDRHTVVYDRFGRAWGDPELIRLAEEHGRLAERNFAEPAAGPLVVLSRLCGLLGLALAVFFGFAPATRARG